jgi:hypothetical protein
MTRLGCLQILWLTITALSGAAELKPDFNLLPAEEDYSGFADYTLLTFLLTLVSE